MICSNNSIWLRNGGQKNEKSFYANNQLFDFIRCEDYPLFLKEKELLLCLRLPKINFKFFRAAFAKIVLNGKIIGNFTDSVDRLFSILEKYENYPNFLKSLDKLSNEVRCLVDRLATFDKLGVVSDIRDTVAKAVGELKEKNSLLNEVELFQLFTKWQRQLGFFAFTKYAKRVGLLNDKPTEGSRRSKTTVVAKQAVVDGVVINGTDLGVDDHQIITNSENDFSINKHKVLKKRGRPRKEKKIINLEFLKDQINDEDYKILNKITTSRKRVVGEVSIDKKKR